jgi:hypothetical protein
VDGEVIEGVVKPVIIVEESDTGLVEYFCGYRVYGLYRGMEIEVYYKAYVDNPNEPRTEIGVFDCFEAYRIRVIEDNRIY